jgi:pyroglutamyl-peptidase
MLDTKKMYGGDLLTISNDAGLFICNYIYYKSLEFTKKNGGYSIFIHIPSDETISIDTQYLFLNFLINEIINTLR